jgi:hypothetical protein
VLHQYEIQELKEDRCPGHRFFRASSLTASVELLAQQFEWGCIEGQSWHSHAHSGSFFDPGEVPPREEFLMLSPFRLPGIITFAGIVTVMFAVCGLAGAQQIAPGASGVTIDKVVIDNGAVQTVRYVVKGGSPRLQALVRRVEWAENELTVVEQLQLLKLDTVVNERRVADFRTAQLTNPYYPPGFIPVSVGFGNGSDCNSPLQKALGIQLAYEATPEAAQQLIGFLEQVQTELDAELKALPPQEKKAAQGPVDELRPRVAALSQSNVAPPKSQPVATTPVVTTPVAARALLQTSPPAPVPAGAKAGIEVEWHGTWYPAAVLRSSGGSTLIHYTGWASSWDEWVPAGRIRSAGAASTVSAPAQLAMPQQLPMPLDTSAFEQMVRQNQEKVRQQIADGQQQVALAQQQILQRHQQIIQQSQLQVVGLQQRMPFMSMRR